MALNNAGALGNAEYPFIAIAPIGPGVVEPDRALSMGQIELDCLLMLKEIIWNRTVFDTEILYLC